MSFLNVEAVRLQQAAPQSPFIQGLREKFPEGFKEKFEDVAKYLQEQGYAPSVNNNFYLETKVTLIPTLSMRYSLFHKVYPKNEGLFPQPIAIARSFPPAYVPQGKVFDGGETLEISLQNTTVLMGASSEGSVPVSLGEMLNVKLETIESSVSKVHLLPRNYLFYKGSFSTTIEMKEPKPREEGKPIEYVRNEDWSGPRTVSLILDQRDSELYLRVPLQEYEMQVGSDGIATCENIPFTFDLDSHLYLNNEVIPGMNARLNYDIGI